MGERVTRKAEGGRERHPVDVPGRARRRGVQVAVGVDPDHAAGLAGGPPQARERAQGNRVVPAQHEGQGFLGDDVRDEPREARAGVEDLGEKPRPFVADGERLGLAGREVAPVDHRAPERPKALLEPGVADRGGAHVDAAPSLAEVERRADDRHGPRSGTHGGVRLHQRG